MTTNSGYAAYIRNIHILAWKAPTPTYAYTNAEISYSSTETTLQTLTFIPSVQQDYLILASLENRISADNFPFGIRLYIDGALMNQVYHSPTYHIANIDGVALAYDANLTPTSHTIRLTGIMPTGYTGYARNTSIIAIPLSSLAKYNSSYEKASSTSSTTYVDVLPPYLSYLSKHLELYRLRLIAHG